VSVAFQASAIGILKSDCSIVTIGSTGSTFAGYDFTVKLVPNVSVSVNGTWSHNLTDSDILMLTKFSRRRLSDNSVGKFIAGSVTHPLLSAVSKSTKLPNLPSVVPMPSPTSKQPTNLFNTLTPTINRATQSPVTSPPVVTPKIRAAFNVSQIVANYSYLDDDDKTASEAAFIATVKSVIAFSIQSKLIIYSVSNFLSARKTVKTASVSSIFNYGIQFSVNIGNSSDFVMNICSVLSSRITDSVNSGNFNTILIASVSNSSSSLR
jgi:hypothetical protein